jgi:alanyl-tRNA synthetase
MPTRRLYYDDSFLDSFKAQVLSCEPLVEAEDCQFGPRWGVILDQTLLYPTSGGQPHDIGKLGEANVLDVRDSEEKIIHIVDRPVPHGRVDGCIHWQRRFDHMQQHTGQHLLSAIFQERFGLITVSFHLGEEVSTIDLRGPQPSELIIEGVSRAANSVIFEDREITVRYGTAEEFATQGVRKQVDREGMLRAIEIAGIDLQPCGGTHLRHTGQLGLILIRGCNKIRQDWRVEFVCGGRAEAAARKDASLLEQASAELKCAPEELPASIERLLREREVAVRHLKSLLPKLAEAEAAALLVAAEQPRNGIRVVTQVRAAVQPEFLQHLATALCGAENAVALLADQETGNLVFAQNPKVGRDMNALLKKVFEKFTGRGGGGKDFARGAISSGSDSGAAIEFAKSAL